MTDTRRHFLAAGATATFALLLYGVGIPSSAASARRYPFRLSDAEWRRRLSAEAYQVLRRSGTERAGSSPLDGEHRVGLFHCAGCAQPLFSSAAKFDSGTGWPSFTRPLKGAVATAIDESIMMRRIEVLCRRCGGHLGHVFEDGPRPTGQRWCINGVALKFVPAGPRRPSWRGSDS